jgi:outer membrane protein assembly factor BamB
LRQVLPFYGLPPNSANSALGRILTVVSLIALLAAGSCSESATPSDLYAGPHVAWQVPINNGNADMTWGGVPLVVDGRFYFAEGSNITALSANTGARLWSTTIRNNPAALTSKILSHGSKIFLADHPDVFCLDAATGQILWRYTPDSSASVAESAVDEQAMYIGTRDHKVSALDVNDGHPIWTVDIGPDWTELGLVQGISLASDTVYVSVTHWIAHNGYLQSAVIVALDRGTGRELWRYQGAGDKNGIVATPVVAGNNLIADDVIFGSVFAVDRFTGKEVWRRPSAPGGYGPQDSPIVIGDTAFIASNDTYFYALDSKTGQSYWSTMGRGGSFTAGVVCGRYAMGNAQGIDVFERNGGRKNSSLLSAVGPERAFPTSHFASDGKRAFITGILWAWAIDC